MKNMHNEQTRTTSIDYQHPPRPLPIRLGNLGGRALELVGLACPFDAEELIEKARSKTGLHSFGDERFREPLAVLLDSIKQEARLNAFGRLVTRGRIVGALSNRLRAHWFFHNYPEIERIEIKAPVLITGLQRSGTTLLHRLLATDPRFRALASWEAINPAPFLEHGRHHHTWSRDGSNDPVGKNRRKDRRITIAESREKALHRLAPDFFAIHPVEAHSPEEDVLLLDYSFISTVPEATMRVPTYSRWVEAQDQLPAYRYMQDLLKLLLWQRPQDGFAPVASGEGLSRPAPVWLLKSPHHLEYLDTFLSLFPNARIIQTHRDPCVTLPSFCSMLSHGMGLFTDHVDPREIGSHWYRKINRLVTRAMEVRKQHRDNNFLDVYYKDLVADPLQVVEQIYEFLSLDLGESTRERMRQTIAENPQYRFGVHQYTLSSFGFHKNQIKEDFSHYYEHFDLEEEPQCGMSAMTHPRGQS